MREVLKKLVETAKMFAAMTITSVDDTLVWLLEWGINDPAFIAWFERRYPTMQPGVQGILHLEAPDAEFETLVSRYNDTVQTEAFKFDGSRLPAILAGIAQIIALLKQFGIIPAVPTPAT